MSFVGLSLRLSRRVIYRCQNVESFLINSQSRSVHLSCRRLEKDNSEKEKEAREKLNQLLKDIKQSKDKKTDAELKVTLRAKPRKRISQDEAEASKSDSKNEKKKKFLKVKKEDPAKTNDEVQLDSNLIRAARNVASEKSRLEPNEDLKVFVQKKTESDLLKKLKSIAVETDEAKEASEVAGASTPTSNLASLFGTMKIQKSGPRGDSEQLSRDENHRDANRRSFSEEEKAFLEKRKRLRKDQREGEDLYNKVKDLFKAEEPIGVFTPAFEAKSKSETSSTFDKCLQRELRILSTASPKNFLEEMVGWTDNGVLWHFPINNEQGMEEKDMEPFYKHVFLEPHLEPWCPPRGPVRHFMEVIIVGLSKNPHISVEKKIEHINWFKEYFEKKDHKDILKLTGAIEA